MNIRLIAFLMASVALPTQARPVDSAANSTLAAERAATVQALKRGATVTVTSNSQQYQILPGVRAAESLAQEPPQQTLTRMGGGRMIETKGSFVVFTAAPQSPTSITTVNGTSYPTAFNPRTGGIGILPGTLNVKLKNVDNANAVAADHGLEVVRVFAHLQTAFYRIKSGQDVVAAAALLTADPRVSSAEVEVIENVNVPH